MRPDVRNRLTQLVGIFVVLIINAQATLVLGQSDSANSSTLTSVASVLALTDEEIDKQPAFDLEVTLYHYDKNFHFFFVGQGDNFISCDREQSVLPPFGSRVRISGIVQTGHIKPICSVIAMEVISKQFDFADPQTIQFDQMLLGDKDCHFVSLDALVEHVRIGMGYVVLGCVQGSTRFAILIDEEIDSESAIGLVGAEIQVSGNLGVGVLPGSSEGDKEAIGFELVTNLEKLQVVEHHSKIGYAPLRRIADLWHDKNATDFRLSGQITYVQDNGFFIQTNDSGTWIYNDTEIEIATGSFVEVLGRRTEQGQLHALVCENRGSRPLHQPSLADIDDVLLQNRDARRVKLHGKYLGVHTAALNADAISLDVGGHHVDVYMQPEQFATLDLESAKEITVTGTASFHTDTEAELSVFTPTLDDITVTKRKVQWSSRTMSAGVMTAIGLLGLCLYWGANLSRQVKQKRVDLEKVLAELRLSYESIQEGIIILGLDKRVSYANRRASEVLGFEIPVGMQVEDLPRKLDSNGADENFLAFWNSLNSSLTESRESELKLTQGEQCRIIEAFTSPVQNADGEFVNRLWTFHDVTEKQQLQDSLTHAQKQEAVGRLASGFAHDFNNLLTGIICSLSVAKSDPTKTIEETSTCINTALSASERAASLVSQILCFSRKRPLNLEINNVNQIIERARDLLAPSLPPDTELRCELDPKTPLVEVDGTQLEQVLLNLLLNANDAIDDSGQITISTFGHQADQTNYAVISIHDTGCGMSTATREKIFEPFFTSKEAGTGLGLSMSSGIIQQHGGHIECDSVQAVGTEFRIYLPAIRNRISATDLSETNPAIDSPSISSS